MTTNNKKAKTHRKFWTCPKVYCFVTFYPLVRFFFDLLVEITSNFIFLHNNRQKLVLKFYFRQFEAVQIGSHGQIRAFQEERIPLSNRQ